MIRPSLRAAVPALHGFVLCLSTTPPADAQSNLEPVVVTATRTPQRVDDTLGDITVIDRVELERQTGHTLAEVLARQPGVQLSANGGLGSASAVFLNGTEARHTLLLVDGVRYGSATLGLPVWDNIPVEAIERIEIVRGPLSGLYGSDAVGGVVQIFTRRGREGLHPSGAATAGSHGYGALSAGIEAGQGAWTGALQAMHQRTDGFSATNERVPFGAFDPDRDGFRENTLTGALGYAFGADWRATAHLLESDGLVHYDDGPGADARAKVQTQVMSVEAGGPVLPGWRTTLRVSRSKDAYDTVASASAFTDLGTIATVQRQYTWENTIATPIGTVLALAEQLHQDVSKPAAPFDTGARTINAGALGLTGRAGPHGWQLNLRNDHDSQFGSQTTGSLAYGYDLTPAWRVAASYGTSFVAPSFNLLYYPGFGNPDLKPEKGRQGELSLRWADEGREFRAAWFDNRIRGFITSGPQPQNIPRARIDGLSLSYQARQGRWSYFAGFDALDAYDDADGDPDHGKRLPRRARNSLKGGVDTRFGAWVLGTSLSAFSRRYDDTANTQPLGGYATVDLHANWEIDAQWTLSLKLNNLADKSYETAYGYNQPGREAFVTLRYAGR